MRIAIIGAGAAGLATSWLLSQHHEVTVYEKQARVGGHAHTVEVEQDGKPVYVEAGAEFFSDRMFPTFVALLNHLGVALHRYPVTACVYTTDNRQITVLPPLLNGRILWSAMKPTQIDNLLELQHVLKLTDSLMKSADTSITFGQYLDRLPVSRRFKDDFLWPFFLAQWCVEPEEFRQFAAYNVFKYAARNRPGGLGLGLPVMIRIGGGTQAYIQKLVQTAPRATIRCSTAIAGITRASDQYLIMEADGTSAEFDHLIVATGPRDALSLLSGLPEAKRQCAELAHIDTFKTTIAVHGDRRWMPADEKYWAVANTRYDGKHAQNTIYHAGASRLPIFRSWVTFDTELPESLYAVTTYEHPKVNLAYYQAQHNLLPLQGRDNLWLAGLYMHDIDCHESAIRSAVNIAQQLDPTSPALKVLS
jgi:predicted NAD/FAD-binding protein